MEKEIIICAAIKTSEGQIVRGHRHNHCFSVLHELGLSRYGHEQGFMTSTNRFVDRTEACNLQKAAGIASVLPEKDAYLHGELYSEDLY